MGHEHHICGVLVSFAGGRSKFCKYIDGIEFIDNVFVLRTGQGVIFEQTYSVRSKRFKP